MLFSPLFQLGGLSHRISSRIYPVAICKGISKFRLLRLQGVGHEGEIIAHCPPGHRSDLWGSGYQLAIQETW